MSVPSRQLKRRHIPSRRWPEQLRRGELLGATVLGVREVAIDCPHGAFVVSFGLARRADGGPHIEMMLLWMLKASDEQYAWARAHQQVIVTAVIDLVKDEWARRFEARFHLESNL